MLALQADDKAAPRPDDVLARSTEPLMRVVKAMPSTKESAFELAMVMFLPGMKVDQVAMPQALQT